MTLGAPRAVTYMRWIDGAQAKTDAAKAALVNIAKHRRETGAGVSVTRFWKIGNVDYKRVPELIGVDLNLYRGSMREEVRVTVA